MNDPDLQQFETELNRLKPSQSPRLRARLSALEPRAKPAAQPQPLVVRSKREPASVWPWLTVLSPVSAAAIILFSLWISGHLGPTRRVPASRPANGAAGSALIKDTAPSQKGADALDAVEIDRQLVATYEAVAELPDSGPVVFRCDQWEDRVIYRDPSRGIAVERRTPRLEIVPVRFESY